MFNRLALRLLICLAISTAPVIAVAKNSFALLAVSWQPAFCEQRSDRPECASQTPPALMRPIFSLHGLWPGSRGRSYCNITSSLVKLDKSGRWGKLPDLQLDPALASRLRQIMPGTQIVSTASRMGKAWFLPRKRFDQWLLFRFAALDE